MVIGMPVVQLGDESVYFVDESGPDGWCFLEIAGYRDRRMNSLPGLLFPALTGPVSR